MTSIENNIYKVEVVKTSGLNKTTKAIRFRFANKSQAKNFTFVPGQFIIIGVPGYGDSALTITTSPSELPEFEIAVRSVGVATQAMLRLKAGDIAYFRGPFGNSIISGKACGKELIFVAGGIGLAPLRSMIHAIRDDKGAVDRLTLVYGAKSPEELIFKGEFAAWSKFAEVHLTVDKADHQWTGEIGRVNDSLAKLKPGKEAVAVVCGPPVMYKAIAKTLLGLGLGEENIEFMLERRIKCGIGKCQHCTCGEKYVCIDGPTFTWKELKNNPEAFK